jgi:hypothetical protein
MFSSSSSFFFPFFREPSFVPAAAEFEILNQVPCKLALGISVQMLLFHHGTLTSVTAP